MNPLVLSVLFKGIGMLLAILGGLMIAYYGYQIFRYGQSNKEESIVFALGKTKINARSSGAVIMATAFMWGWLGYLLKPNVEPSKAPRVYLFSTPEFNFTSQPLPSGVRMQEHGNKISPEQLRTLFHAAALNQKTTEKSKSILELDGKAAQIDAGTIRYLKSETGRYVLTTRVTTDDKSALVAYEPVLENGTILFIPAGVRKYLPEAEFQKKNPMRG
jgi:hypothetical protein